MFKHLETQSRSQAVRDQLLDAIRQGRFAPGDRLPAENALVETFGVSRVSVRMALGMLETMGVIETQHGRGSFVTRGPGAGYLDNFGAWLGTHRDEVLDLMKVRGALDELAAAEAARTQSAELAAVVEIDERFSAAASGDASTEELVALDISFHNTIAVASGIQLLPQLLSELNELFTNSRRAAFTLPQRVRQSAVEHHRIVEAIVAGDAEAARASTAAHLRSARSTLARLAEDPQADSTDTATVRSTHQ